MPLADKASAAFSTSARRVPNDKSATLTVLDHAAFADLKGYAAFGQVDTVAFTARKPERDRAVIMGCGRGDHMGQFGFVRGGHDHKPGKVREVGHIECPGVRGAIRPDQARAVDGKAHRQALDGHVMHHLVVPALQECGVHRAEWFHPARRQSGGEMSRHVVLRCQHQSSGWVAFGKQA